MIDGTRIDERTALSALAALRLGNAAAFRAGRSMAVSLLCCLLFGLTQQASAAIEAGTGAAWAQQRICEGKPADFSELLKAGADPRQSRGWDDPRRRLNRDFLIEMIGGGGCPVPPLSIEIVGAWFPEAIDLEGANIPMQFQIRDSRFDSAVHLERVGAGKLLSFAGSRFGGPLLMTELTVRGSLLLGDGASFEDKVVLSGAGIDGQANFATRQKCAANTASEDRERCADDPVATHFASDLDLSGARVSRVLDFRNVIADGTVKFDRARIDGDLRLSGSRFGGILSMDSIRVGESVEAWGVVWGQQQTDGSCVSRFAPQQANPPDNRPVNEPAGAPQPGQWLFYNASIGSGLYLTGACLADLTTLNLAGTRIGGQLFLGSIDHSPANAWGPQSTMILRNASVGKIQDLPLIRTIGGAGERRPSDPPGMPRRESWPLHLELDGFSYASWDGLDRQEMVLGDGGRRIVPPRDEDWLIRWLARDRSYARQRYEQLAKVMASQGRQDVSNDVLFASHEIERCIAIDGLSSKDIEACVLRHSGIAPSPVAAAAAVPAGSHGDQLSQGPTEAVDQEPGFLDRFGDYGVRTTIFLLNGYGYRPLWALGWFAVLIAIGTLLFRYRTEEGRGRSIWFATEYTFDTLLPAVNLCKEFNDITIENAVRYYFIALKVLGYVFVATLLQIFYQIVGRSLT